MSLFDIFKSSNEPTVEDKTLVVIDWDKVRKNVQDLSFVAEYKQPKVWVFVRKWANENLVDRLINEQPFDIKEQPQHEKYLSHYLIANVMHELFAVGGYNKVVFICGDESYIGTADFIRDLDFETDLKIFDRRQRVSNDKGGRGQERDDRGDRGDRGDRSDRGDRGDRGSSNRGRDNSRYDSRGRKEDRSSNRNHDRNKGKERGGSKRKSSTPEMEHTPQEYANMIVNRIKKDLELNKSYTNSRLAQMVKSTTGHAISNLIGNRGNRQLLDALQDKGQLEVIDNQHFKLLEQPDRDVIAELIGKNQHRRSRRGGGKGRGNRNDNQNDDSDNSQNKNAKQQQPENQPA